MQIFGSNGRLNGGASLFPGKVPKTVFTRSGDFKVVFHQQPTTPLFAGPGIPSPQIPMAFTDDYADILSPFIEQYQTAKNDKERKALAQNAAEAVRKSRDLGEDTTVNLPKDLEKVCLSFVFFLFLF
jgi:hypothetical protein